MFKELTRLRLCLRILPMTIMATIRIATEQQLFRMSAIGGSISLLGFATSTLNHAVIRSGINADHSVLEMEHSVVENNKNGGVMFMQSSGSVIDTIIRNHIEPQGNGPMGLYLGQGSTVAAHNVLFRNNERGIVADNALSLINNGGIDIDGSNQTKTYLADLLS